MRRILGRTFYGRTGREVAPDLLGKFIVRRRNGRIERYLITETEAYDSIHDLASHASKGKTKRTETMFGPPGYWYVYLIYGLYEMLNIVTGPEGYPSAVLIRGVQDIEGPGKLTRELGISRLQNKQRAITATGLWIEEGIVVRPREILRTPRIGVAYAGEWAKKPWRFVLKSKGASRVRRPRP